MNTKTRKTVNPLDKLSSHDILAITKHARMHGTLHTALRYGVPEDTVQKVLDTANKGLRPMLEARKIILQQNTVGKRNARK